MQFRDAVMIRGQKGEGRRLVGVRGGLPDSLTDPCAVLLLFTLTLLRADKEIWKCEFAVNTRPLGTESFYSDE